MALPRSSQVAGARELSRNRIVDFSSLQHAAQVGVAPPSFVFFTNVATSFHFSYERFLVNQLRERFGFVGTPIRVQVRRRAKKGTRKGI